MLKRDKNSVSRCRLLTEGVRGDGPVVYWMDRDQRAADNWALLWAQQEGIIRNKGLRVVFCYQPGVFTRRQAEFGLSGLKELHQRLQKYRIEFVLLEGDPEARLHHYLTNCDAHLLVTDFNPLRTKFKVVEQLVNRLSIPVYEVDAHNIIPAWVTSEKKEYGAYTIRPKINRLLEEFLTEIPQLEQHPIDERAENNQPDYRLLAQSAGDQRAGSVSWLKPGENAAHKALFKALKSLETYADFRNDPTKNAQSNLSPFLHFGQLSAQKVAYEVQCSTLSPEVKEAFLEELIVRRELSDNYCFYEPAYDTIAGYPDWARKTLDEHRNDTRPYLYSLAAFETGNTHETLWNGCQHELLKRGKLHGYLRMYWAKKILEWTRSPEEAQEIAINLNDGYSLDGCDPNGYVGIAWALGGVHDRAWKERDVFGKIRYMNEAGCRRKFDVNLYLDQVATYQDPANTSV